MNYIYLENIQENIAIMKINNTYHDDISELELYEENSNNKNKQLIGKYNIDSNYIINKTKYNEIKIEYEINEELNINIRLSDEKNFLKELNCKLYIYNS